MDGATLSFDIERANTDQAYWSSLLKGQVLGDYSDRSATERAATSASISADFNSALAGSYIPVGWNSPDYRDPSVATPKYIGGERKFLVKNPVVTSDSVLQNQRSTKITPSSETKFANDAQGTVTNGSGGVNNDDQTVSSDWPPGGYANDAQASNMGPSPDDVAWRNFYPMVEGRHNVLHDLNSYNYIITLVSLSEEQVNDPSTYKDRIINAAGVESSNFYIVAKSGGYERNNSEVIVTKGVATDPAGNNQKYKGIMDDRNKDLFIENLDFETRPGINDMGNSNLTTGTFEVTEPHSVSQFYRELFNAARFSGHPDYIDAPFLLVISFIGRKADEDDAVVPPKSTRYLPIRIQNSEMQVSEAGARYSVRFMGYNSTATKTVVNTLWEDTQPYVNKKESVESIAASVFHKHTVFEEKRMKKFTDDLKSDLDRSQKVQEKKLEARKALNKDVEIGAFVPNKYYVWFADGYASGFPSSAEGVSKLSGEWSSAVGGWTDNTEFEGIPKVPGSPGNDMGNSGLDKKIRPQGALKIDSYETNKELRRLEYNKQKDELSAAQGTLNSELQAFDATRNSLAALLKKSGIREDDTQTNKLADPTLGVFSKTDEAKKQVDVKKDEAVAIANLLTGGPQPFSTPPAQSKLSAAEVAEVVKLRTEIIRQSGQIQKDADAVAKADEALTKLQESYEAFTTDGTTTYNLTSTGTPWAFRKGTNLMTVIETLITNSQYTDIFNDEAKLKAIQNSEMIPWFKVEILSKVIGFDVMTMRFVHEFHYVVSPFDIHYSNMPGVNIQFTTDQLKKMAIREYNFIYTGKNIDVLGYDIRYNNLFTTPLLLNPPTFDNDKNDDVKEAVSNTYIEKIENAVQANVNGQSGFTPATPTGKLTEKEGPNNRDAIATIFQDFLYNAPFERHLILSDLDIVGDPVYIVGSGITDRPRVTTADITTRDGEMNTFTHEPHVILNIRYPEDIPTSNELDVGQFEQKLMRDQYSGVYQIFNVRNNLSEGVFKQTLRLARKKNQPEDYRYVDDTPKPSQSTFTSTEGST